MENLEWILNDNKIPIEVRSRVFIETTTKQVRSIFQDALSVLDEDTLESIRKVVGSSLSFLSTPETIRNIGQFISHDYETFSHSVHVFTYTMMLVKSLKPGLEESSLIDVGVGALLHDIGKINIPTAILNKPGPLNDKEWVTIKTHPVHGMRMCTSVPLAQTSLNCIMFHHEKYDGTGYPTGMKKEEIPLPVRIITCCDVYDALTSKRPYSEAQTPFEALKIMNNQMKTAFDLNVFKAFIEILSKNKEKNDAIKILGG
jgi:putative nucleotidyltransferase with HDIG domain